jgi:hypothetical protein
MSRAPRPESLAAGLVLVALGVLWTLSNMGRLDLLATLRTWWPLTLVVWGAAELVAWGARRIASPAGRGNKGVSDPVLPSQLDGASDPTDWPPSA